MWRNNKFLLWSTVTPGARFTALFKEIKKRIYLGSRSSTCLQVEACVHQAIVIRKLIFFYVIWPQ